MVILCFCLELVLSIYQAPNWDNTYICHQCIFGGLMLLHDARVCVVYVCVALKHIPYYTLYIVCIRTYTFAAYKYIIL